MHASGCANTELTRLLFLRKVGEPPGDANHQIGYDHDVVEICAACNGATLERLRHDCFDFEEVWDQYEWYELSPEDGVRLKAVAAACPGPLDPHCACKAHKSLRESAGVLPSSSWDAVFEEGAHRHVVTLAGRDNAPAFKLLSSGAKKNVPGVATVNVKPRNIKGIVLVMFAWPLVLAATLFAWFRYMHLPLIVDVLAVAIAIPVSFIAAGILLAAVSVLLGKAPPQDSGAASA